VAQSGSAPATHGRISKAGIGLGPPRAGRGELVGGPPARPLHAFYGRVRARRGHSVAIVATARKLACLFWCLLGRHEDYAYQQPSLTAKKLRLLEIRAGSPSHKGLHTGTFATRERMRAAERELAAQAESAYKRMIAEWQRTQAKKNKGAGATPGRASGGPSSGQATRQVQAPGPAL
jgi:transposase